ncbi:transcriptional regulator [Escherichia coli]|nr:transcriptional regulator [Salmonella enterica]
MRVYLILLKQLEEVFNQNKVVRIAIQRMDKKKWIPLFDVKNSEGGVITCSLRVQSGEGVRTWADLRILADMLRDDFNAREVGLFLDEPDFIFPDDGMLDKDEYSD